MDFNKGFEMNTDISDFQLVAVNSQEGKPIFFYSRKLTTPQKRYTVTEMKLLSTVKTLKGSQTILLGQQL